MHMRLYHYLPAQYALDDINRRRIKIARFADMNDPFELVAADFSDPVQRKVLRGWKETFQEKWGILCFSRSWQNAVLWSHYADKHKGIVLGFDIDDKYPTSVKYRSARLNVDVVGLRDEGKLDAKLMQRLQLTKFRDWSYEKEVRVSVGLDDVDEESGLYFYDFSDEVRLVEVIAGPLYSGTEQQLVDALSDKDSGVNFVKSRLAFQSFKVVRDKRGFA